MDVVNEESHIDPTAQPRRTRPRRVAVASVFAAAVLGGAGGAALYAHTASTRTVTQAAAPTHNVSNTSRALTVAEIYRKNVGSVVEVQTSTAPATASPFGGSGSQSQGALGTGFVYDSRGDIVTNQHVVDGAKTISVKLDDGSTYKATLVGSDASHDLAVLHVDATAGKLRPLVLADSSTVQPGDDVVAIGDQFGLVDSVTTGIVSALNRTITSPNDTGIPNAIQTDAAINHGSSGGVLLNSRAQVIGVTSQIEGSSDGNNGVGFAIPSNTVAQVAAHLLGSA